MPTFDDGENLGSVRTKINAAITSVDNLEAQGGNLYAAYETRAEAVAAIAGGLSIADGGVLSAAGLMYLADDSATDISDMPGFVPFGDITPDHFAFNASPGNTDMSTATQAAVEYAASFNPGAAFASGAEVVFGAAIYRLDTTINITSSGVSLRGQGRNATQLRNPNATKSTVNIAASDPLNDTVERCHIYDLQFWNNSTNPSEGAHITATRAKVTIQGCELINHYRGVEFLGTLESCRVLDTDITQGSNTTSLSSRSCAVAILRAQVSASVSVGVQDSTDSLYYTEPNSVFIDNTNFRSNNFGMQEVVLIGCGDGLHMSNSHWGFATDNVVTIAPEQTNIGFTSINFINVFFDPLPGTTDYGVRIQDLFGVGDSTLGDVKFQDCTVAGPDLDAFNCSVKCDRIFIQGNTIKSVGRHGVQINNSSARDWIISDNSFFDGNTASANGAGVLVQNGDNINVRGNIFRSWFRGVQISPTAVNVHVSENTVNGASSGDSIFVAANQPANNFFGRNYVTESTTVASAATVKLPQGPDVFSITGTTGITNIRTVSSTSSTEGRRVTLVFADALTVTHGTGNISLSGGSNFTTSANATLSLVYTGSTWHEVGRSA